MLAYINYYAEYCLLVVSDGTKLICMNGFENPYIYYCLGNFLFVIVCCLCAIVRWCHVCQEYQAMKSYYFPARKIVTAMFGIQLLQSLYWMNVFSDELFFYASLFGVLIIPPFFVMMERNFYFFSPVTKRELAGHFLVPMLLLLFVLYGAYDKQMELSTYRLGIQLAATTLFAAEFSLVIKGQVQVWHALREQFEMEYSDAESFPNLFARRKVGMTLGWSLLLLLVLWADSRMVKLGVDVALSLIAVQFLLTILNAQRKSPVTDPEGEIEEEEDGSPSSLRSTYLSESQRLELEQRIVDLLKGEELFKQSDLSLDVLVKRIGNNRSYISEAISLSPYGSFYKMVNHFRLEYAKQQLLDYPDIKVEQLAFDSGFSSRYMLTRTFKECYGTTPTEWRKNKENFI